ncbi:hypothetical protein NHX12_030397 [Muraenolepis orangiensis]|uniref:Prostate transmembrane protein, androgen induced 1 n=1 Tax=Muraenolepis orangiensis TaxID=630683 RepID=A0A9Q0EA27_9TELE|nr:hypothetical protein NHX12_030397 [Muraenolepis orangiensis]
MQPAYGNHNHAMCVQTQECAQLEHAHTRRRHLPLANEAGLWTNDSSASASGSNEHQVYNPRRFQPTYPYLPQSLIDLPPTIALSDGEEPPPYQGPCTLQLRDPEQQMELNRESVRAPPNRTVFDSHLLSPTTPCLHTRLQAPPPSVHTGISVHEAQEALTRHQKQGTKVEGAPPAYSEVIGHYYHPASLTPDLSQNHAHRTVPSQQAPPSMLIHGVLRPLPPHQQAPPTPGSVDNRNARNTKDKPQKPRQV